MADEEVVNEEESQDEEAPTELEVLQEISDNIKYFIKCTIPNSVYSDFEFPESEGE